jgi:hypothetical protein
MQIRTDIATLYPAKEGLHRMYPISGRIAATTRPGVDVSPRCLPTGSETPKPPQP